MPRASTKKNQQARRESAAARQAIYDAMTPDEKRAHLIARGAPPASKEFWKLDRAQG